MAWRRWTALELALLCWMFLATPNYLAWHSLNLDDLITCGLMPLLDARARAVLAAMWNAARAAGVTVLLLAASCSLGLSAARWIGLRASAALEEAVFSLLLGVGAFALLVLGAGLAGFYSAGSYTALLAAALLPGTRLLPALARRLRAEHAAPPPGWARPALALAGLVQAGALCCAFTPPHISDELSIHLGHARGYLWQHKIGFMQTDACTLAFPHMNTLLMGAPLAFGLVFGIKFVHWAMGIVGGLALLVLVSRRSRESRWAVGLTFFTMPVVWIAAGRAFSDMFLAAYAAGAFAAADRARPGPPGTPGRGTARPVYALLAGAFAGFAGSSKYTGLIIGVCLIPFLSFRLLVLAGTSASLVVLPWLVRNWAWIGNPVFPFFFKTLGGFGWDETLNDRLRKELLQGALPPSVMDILKQLHTIPWRTAIYNLGSYSDARTGPLFPMAIGLLFGGLSLAQGLALGLFFTAVSFSAAGMRYLVPVVPLMLDGAAGGLDRVLARLRRRGWLVAALTGLMAFQAVEFYAIAWGEFDDPLAVILGRERVGPYLDRILAPPLYYPNAYSHMLDGVARDVPPGARVMLIGGYGGQFWIPRETVFGPLPSRPLPVVYARESRTPEEIRKRMRQGGFGWVLINLRSSDVFFDYWRVWDWGLTVPVVRWRDYWDRHAVRVWRFRDQFALYRIAPGPVRQPHQVTPGIEEETGKLLLTMIRKHSYNDAAALLQAMQAVFPGNTVLWSRAAAWHAGQGHVAEARATAELLARMAPGSPDWHRAMADALFAAKDYAGAATHLELYARKNAYDLQIWTDLMGIYNILGRPDDFARAARQLTYIQDVRIRLR